MARASTFRHASLITAETTTETLRRAKDIISTLHSPGYAGRNDVSESSFSPSTVDVVIIVAGTAVVAIFFFGLCYSCIRLMSRQRSFFHERRHHTRASPTQPAGPTYIVPFPQQRDTGPSLPPYSPPAVFPDEPPPQYSACAEVQPWRATSPRRAHT